MVEVDGWVVGYVGLMMVVDYGYVIMLAVYFDV